MYRQDDLVSYMCVCVFSSYTLNCTTVMDSHVITNKDMLHEWPLVIVCMEFAVCIAEFLNIVLR